MVRVYVIVLYKARKGKVESFREQEKRAAERTDVQRPGGHGTTTRMRRTATPARSAAAFGYAAPSVTTGNPRGTKVSHLNALKVQGKPRHNRDPKLVFFRG
jgi:hypothetical protein